MQAPWSTVVIIERKNQTFRGTPSDPSVNIKLHTATADDRRCSYFQSIMTAFHDCQKHFKHLHATWHVSERLQTYHKHAMQSETFSDHHKWVSKHSNKFSIQLRNPQEMESTTVNHAAVPNAESILRSIPGLSSSSDRTHHAETKGDWNSIKFHVNPLLDIKSFRHSKDGRKCMEFQFEYSKLHHTTRWETLRLYNHLGGPTQYCFPVSQAVASLVTKSTDPKFVWKPSPIVPLLDGVL